MKDLIPEIYKTMGELVGEVRGVNKRLDKMNGTLDSHELRINRNESLIDDNKGMMKIIGGIGVFIGSIVTIIAQWLIKRE